MRFSLSLVVFLLMSFLPSFLGSSIATTTEPPTTTPPTTLSSTHSTPDNQDELLTTTVGTTSSFSFSTNLTTTKGQAASGEELLVLEEVGRLLGQMREVAASMQEARDEHSRLAQAVAQISAAVKDMGEHNLHIKKKVRKMSKALRGGTHHRKVKDGLKSLQRDHQRILHAMSLQGINVTRSHNHNHTHNGTHNKSNNSSNNHHNHNRNHHDRDSSSSSSSSSGGSSGSKSGGGGNGGGGHQEKKKKNKNKSESRGEHDNDEAETHTSHEHLTTSRESQVPQEGLPEASVTDNLIPDLVVDPPGFTDPPLPMDCTEVMQRGNWTSGTYMIHPKGLHEPIKVWCDHTTNGGGWTIILTRQEQEAQENFNRIWAEYKSGFGDTAGEHWIGLDALHSMTKGRNHELRVNITDWSDNEAWAEWKEFSVAGEDHFYRLTVNRYTSISQAGDALKWHNGMKFSTPDRDNDALMGGHCAKKNHGGWWYRGYRGCYQAHPTGQYQQNPSPPPEATGSNSRNFDLGPVLVWQNWRGENYYPKTLFLMFRPSLN